jgi:hypothetical protein
MSTNTIIGLDPGGTTGFCIYYPQLKKFTVGQIDGENCHRRLSHLLQANYPRTVVCERFDYRAKQRSADLTPVEMIGVLKLFQQAHPRVEVVFQTQLKGKTGLWTDNKLKVLDLYIPATPHGMDAVRQVLYYLTVEKDDPYWVERYKELS